MPRRMHDAAAGTLFARAGIAASCLPVSHDLRMLQRPNPCGCSWPSRACTPCISPDLETLSGRELHCYLPSTPIIVLRCFPTLALSSPSLLPFVLRRWSNSRNLASATTLSLARRDRLGSRRSFHNREVEGLGSHHLLPQSSCGCRRTAGT